MHTSMTMTETLDYRARYYDPNVGRFLSEDSMRFRSGINFYDYVLNSPTNLMDPSGKDAGPKGPGGYPTGSPDPLPPGVPTLGGYQRFPNYNSTKINYWNHNRPTPDPNSCSRIPNSSEPPPDVWPQPDPAAEPPETPWWLLILNMFNPVRYTVPVMIAPCSIDRQFCPAPQA